MELRVKFKPIVFIYVLVSAFAVERMLSTKSLKQLISETDVQSISLNIESENNAIWITLQ